MSRLKWTAAFLLAVSLAIFLLFFISSMLIDRHGTPIEVEFVFSAGFHGDAKVIFDETGGTDFEAGSPSQILIPASGIAHIRDHTFKYNPNGVVLAARDTNGTMISIGYLQFHDSLGTSPSQSTKAWQFPSVGKNIEMFVGTLDEAEEYYKHITTIRSASKL